MPAESPKCPVDRFGPSSHVSSVDTHQREHITHERKGSRLVRTERLVPATARQRVEPGLPGAAHPPKLTMVTTSGQDRPVGGHPERGALVVDINKRSLTNVTSPMESVGIRKDIPLVSDKHTIARQPAGEWRVLNVARRGWPTSIPGDCKQSGLEPAVGRIEAHMVLSWQVPGFQDHALERHPPELAARVRGDA